MAMVESYQLPGQFQVPDLSKTAFLAGASAGDGGGGSSGSSGGLNTDSQGAADWDYFAKTMTRFTDIYNANRQMALRERSFLNDVRNQDREFQLRQERQNYDISNSDRLFQLRKELQDTQLRNENLQIDRNQFLLDETKRQQELTQRAIKEAPQLMDQWRSMYGDKAGYAPDYEMKKSEFILKYAADPAYQKVLQTVFGPYDLQYQTYTDNKLQLAESKIQSLVLSGKYNDTKINGVPVPELYKQVQEARKNGDQVTAYATMMAIDEGLGQTRKVEGILEQAQLGQIMQQATGLPVTSAGLTSQGQATLDFGSRRGTTAGTTQGTKPLTKDESERLAKAIEDSDARLKKLEEDLSNTSDPVRREEVQRQIREEQNNKWYLEDIEARDVEAMGAKVTPPSQGSGATPSRSVQPNQPAPSAGGTETMEATPAPAPSGAAGVFAPRSGVQIPSAPSFPATQPKGAAPAVTPTVPQPAKPVRGYVTSQGDFVAPNSSTYRLLVQQGETLTPISNAEDAAQLKQVGTDVLDFVTKNVQPPVTLSSF